MVDDLGWNGRVDREADVETANLESVIFELFRMLKTLTASSPLTPPKVGRSVSTDITQELIRRCHLQMRDVPYSIHEFVRRHYGLDRQLSSGWRNDIELHAGAPCGFGRVLANSAPRKNYHMSEELNLSAQQTGKHLLVGGSHANCSVEAYRLAMIDSRSL